MSNNKKQRRGIVYSTNPDYQYEHSNQSEETTLPPGEQNLYVSLDRKNRKGKSVTLIAGFIGSQLDLKELGRSLKVFCGSGGSVEDGIILVQGDCREKVLTYLSGEGYTAKKSGG